MNLQSFASLSWQTGFPRDTMYNDKYNDVQLRRRRQINNPGLLCCIVLVSIKAPTYAINRPDIIGVVVCWPCPSKQWNKLCFPISWLRQPTGPRLCFCIAWPQVVCTTNPSEYHNCNTIIQAITVVLMHEQTSLISWGTMAGLNHCKQIGRRSPEPSRWLRLLAFAIWLFAYPARRHTKDWPKIPYIICLTRKPKLRAREAQIKSKRSETFSVDDRFVTPKQKPRICFQDLLSLSEKS